MPKRQFDLEAFKERMRAKINAQTQLSPQPASLKDKISQVLGIRKQGK